MPARRSILVAPARVANDSSPTDNVLLDLLDLRLDGLGGVTEIDHIVKYQAAILMHCAAQLRNGTKRGDNKRDPVAGDHLQLLLQNIIAAMHDQIDAKGRRRPARLGLDGGKTFADDS